MHSKRSFWARKSKTQGKKSFSQLCSSKRSPRLFESKNESIGLGLRKIAQLRVTWEAVFTPRELLHKTALRKELKKRRAFILGVWRQTKDTSVQGAKMLSLSVWVPRDQIILLLGDQHGWMDLSSLAGRRLATNWHRTESLTILSTITGRPLKTKWIFWWSDNNSKPSQFSQSWDLSLALTRHSEAKGLCQRSMLIKQWVSFTVN